jgi:hypothetical protein
MRFQSLTLFLALGAAGTVACGGIGTAGDSGGTGSPPLKNGTYQAPPGTYDTPGLPSPTDYEPPGTDYETPPDQSEAGGPGGGATIGAVCSRLCRDVLALHCADVPTDPAAQVECQRGCSELEIEIPCPGQFAAALSCILDNWTLTCEIFEGGSDAELDENLVASCRAPLEEFARCAGSDVNPEPPPEQPGDCQPNSCNNCFDRCQECLCETDNDVEYCTDTCINQ